jgi:hypothetical protein
MALPRQSASEILRSAEARDNYLRGGGGALPGQPDSPRDPYRRIGVRRRSIMYDLPYWQVQ